MSLFKTNETAFGLDISDRSLRLIQLRKIGKKISVQSYNEVKLPPECLKSGEIKQPEVFLEHINKLTKTRHGHGKLSQEVIVVLPEDRTFLKIIEIPLVKKDEIESQIKQILPQNIPLDINNVYLDWQVIDSGTTTQKILVGACPKNIVDSYVKILNQAGLIPIVLEIEAAAIARVLIDHGAKVDGAQIIIDIGANRTGLFLYDEEAIQFTVSLPISGVNTTKTISETLDLSVEQAEQAKIVCGLDREKCHGALLEIFSDTIDELARHIHQAIAFYENNSGIDKKVNKIILCGGGSNLINIDQVLKEKLNIPVAISQPWQNIHNNFPDYFNAQESQSFTTVLGLALRGLSPETFL